MSGAHGPALRSLLRTAHPSLPQPDPQSRPSKRTIFENIDLRTSTTVRASRSILRQQMMDLQLRVLMDPRVSRAGVLLAGMPDGQVLRVRTFAASIAESLVAHVERRGRSFGLVVIIDDRGRDDMESRIASSIHETPDGFAIIGAADVLRSGLRHAVINSRV